MFNVLGLVVDAQEQGHEIGAQLLSALEENAKARGINVIRLNSGVQRHEAHQFYELLKGNVGASSFNFCLLFPL